MPTTNTADKLQEIYQIKVTLLDTDPSIWRRLLVPADLTLEQLHHVLQLAMGWKDCHMHEFRIGQQRLGAPEGGSSEWGRSINIQCRPERVSYCFSAPTFPANWVCVGLLMK